MRRTLVDGQLISTGRLIDFRIWIQTLAQGESDSPKRLRFAVYIQEARDTS